MDANSGSLPLTVAVCHYLRNSVLATAVFSLRLPQKSASLELVPPFENQKLNEHPGRSLE